MEAKEAKNSQPNVSFLYTVTCGAFWRPFYCVGVLFMLFRLLSSSVLSHYTAPFLERAGVNLDPLLAAVVIGIFRVASAFIPFVLFSFTSKRTTFVLGGSFSTLGILIGKYPTQKITLFQITHINNHFYSCHTCSPLRDTVPNA